MGRAVRPGDAYAAVIPLFTRALRTGARPLVHGDGGQSRSFAYIDDVVAANLAAATAPAEACSGRAYNIGGNRRSTLLELLDELGAILGVEVDPEHTAPRAGDIRHSFAAEKRQALEAWSAELERIINIKDAGDNIVRIARH